MEHAYIIDGRRSYIGVENGMYKHLPAEVLAAEVLCALVPESVRQTVDEVIVGNGVGASGNIGRLATLTAHFPKDVPAYTVDMQCGSVFEALTIAAAKIKSGQADLIVAGGVDAESTASICLSIGSSVCRCFFGTRLFHRCSIHDFICLPYAIPMMQGKRKTTAKSETMIMQVLQSVCLSGVRIKASSSDMTNHEAVRTERSLESHLSMMMSYKRKNSATSPIHPIMDRVANTNPAVVAPMRKATAATRLNAVAATTVSGKSIVRKLSEIRFIKGAYRIKICHSVCLRRQSCPPSAPPHKSVSLRQRCGQAVGLPSLCHSWRRG